MATDLSETTDRFCDSCGELATFGYGKTRPQKYKNPEGVEKWFCTVCWDYFIGPVEITEEKSDAGPT
jgi:hypothetical protein